MLYLDIHEYSMRMQEVTAAMLTRIDARASQKDSQ
jgi:hypothetical protein